MSTYQFDSFIQKLAAALFYSLKCTAVCDMNGIELLWNWSEQAVFFIYFFQSLKFILIQ